MVLDLGLYDQLRKSLWVQGRNPGRLGRGMGGPGGSGEGIETLPDPSGPSGARSPQSCKFEYQFLLINKSSLKRHIFICILLRPLDILSR